MSKDAITITLPLPDKILHPNGGSRHHPMKVARLVKNARGNAQLCTLSALGRKDAPAWQSARMSAEWYFDVSRLRKHDDDNLTGWLKPYRDGIADAGVVVNDSRLTMGAHEQFKDKSNPRVVITVAAEQAKKDG